MVPDWVAWWALGLSAFAAIGVAYLIYQSLYDTIPCLSFKLQVAGVTRPLKGDFGGEPRRTVAFHFTIWNRTSRPQHLLCSLSVLGERQPQLEQFGGKSYWMWARVEYWDLRTQQPIDPRDFEVPAGDARHIAIQGDLRAETKTPGMLQFHIADSRMGLRHWEYTGEYALPNLERPPTSQAATAPPVAGTG
jgi:hypothetical protein